MKRTILSALLTSAGLSAATLSGVVRDVNDSPVTNAKVTISEPNSEASQEVVTGEDGRFSFEGKGAGQYILKVEKAGFASIFREFDLKAEDTTERDLTLRADGASAAADNSFATGPEKKIRIGGGVAQANLVRKVAPVYPPAAKSAGTQGTVELETIISKEGVPVEIRVVSSPSDDLSASALEAVGQWRYRPTLLNGESVEVVTRIIVNYTLTL